MQLEILLSGKLTQWTLFLSMSRKLSTIYHTEFSKIAKSRKNPLQTRRNISTQCSYFYEEMYARVQPFPPGL